MPLTTAKLTTVPMRPGNGSDLRSHLLAIFPKACAFLIKHLAPQQISAEPNVSRVKGILFQPQSSSFLQAKK